MPAAITTIGFDADDTLWNHEAYYKLTETRFTALLAAHGEAPVISARLLDAERRNLAFYGYGVKGFMLSMIETALEVTNGTVDAAAVREILAIGREMLSHPIEPLPHAAATLAALGRDHRLVLITKGDLFDQERKLAQSGLGDHFHAVEIVSEKTAATYDRLFRRHGDGPERAVMVGNSLKSDILPALEAGSYGVHVPHEHAWALDYADEPAESFERFRRIDHLGELRGVLAAL